MICFEVSQERWWQRWGGFFLFWWCLHIWELRSPVTLGFDFGLSRSRGCFFLLPRERLVFSHRLSPFSWLFYFLQLSKAPSLHRHQLWNFFIIMITWFLDYFYFFFYHRLLGTSSSFSFCCHSDLTWLQFFSCLLCFLGFCLLELIRSTSQTNPHTISKCIIIVLMWLKIRRYSNIKDSCLTDLD